MFTVTNTGGIQLLTSSITVSPGWTNDHVKASAGIAASKLGHSHRTSYAIAPATSITATTVDLAIISGATGTFKKLEAAITGTIATGADRTVTVDVHKSTSAGAFATVLTSTIGFTNGSVLRTAAAAVVSATPAALLVEDILRLIITVAGAAGAQALGLIVTATWDEDYVS